MGSSIKEFAHLQIPLEDVLKATNNFDDGNIIGGGDFGKVYKGQLLLSGKLVKIAVRRLDGKHRQGYIEFWTEISVLSNLKHENIVSLIGFCDANNEKIIINSYNAKGSLFMYINKPRLTWIQRLRICLGVARALSNIHNEDGRSDSVIHRNINSSTILLDTKFVPRLSGFEYSVKYSVYRKDEVLLSNAIGTTGYMDPAIPKTGGVTHKSDIYSFGVVLWEILCGRNAFIPNEEEDNRYLASLARFHYENKTLNTIIPPYLRNQIALKSRTSFSEVAYSCLKDDRVQRPDMNTIVQELENALELQLPYENLKKNFKHLKIQLSDIMLATDNFSEAYRIEVTGYGNLYKAELDYFDKVNSSSLEGKNKVGLPKRRNTVVIKRIAKEDKDGGEIFLTELEMLTTCKHRNIATLLGFCDEDSEMILCIEHASNGYLVDYLDNKRRKKRRSVLTWAKRLKICLDVAHGLKYLHYEMEDQKRIIHFDIKSKNITLDENWGAKIANFGFSLFLPPNQDDDALHLDVVSGTPSYRDPEYENTYRLKRESDVYSFGVVLLEVLCGRVAYSKIYKQGDRNSLAHMARIRFDDGSIDGMIDSLITKERRVSIKSMDKFIKLAYQCVARTQDKRPTMNIVVKELEQILLLQEECPIVDEVPENPLDIIHNIYLKMLEAEEHNRVQQLNVDQRIDKVEETMESKFMHKHGNKLEDLKVSLYEISLATDSLSDKFYRTTRYYNIYKGELPGKGWSTVDIKRLISSEGKQEKGVFFTEIEMLINCKHRNIVPLLGFCHEFSFMFLVIEHPSNGFLDDSLIYIKDKPILTWAKRLKICLDVANGLKYLHQKTIINGAIKSCNIGLDEKWRAKIVYFGNSVLLSPNQDHKALNLEMIEEIDEYTDPEYQETGKLKRESDVYSFGVLMFEILCGRQANDPIYIEEGGKGLAFAARQGFHEGTLMEMMDPMIKEDSGDSSFTLKRGPNKDCLETFIKIAYQCMAEKQDQRPTMKVVVKELQKALIFQDNNKDDPKILLEDITKATQNFNDDNRIGIGGFGKVYIGKVPNGDGFDTIVAKRLDTSGGQGEQQFRNELQILFEYKHDNIIRLVGYCDEKDEKVIVYEYASRGSLDKYLNDARLTWMKRLNICIDVASALEFLHGGVSTKAAVIHRDIKTENILLNDEWKAKLADYGLSLISAVNKETDYVIDRACGTLGYVDPVYLKSGFLTMESDIYSFGVVLFEILCGRSTFAIHKDERQYLPSFIKQRFEKGNHDEVVFEAIKTQIAPKALNEFQTIAYRCLHDVREQRPTAKQVLKQLKKALEFQENESSTGTPLILK